jgi:phosphoesterase RecJ-like protein
MQELEKILTQAHSIVITTHKSPDGDAIGSSLALYHYLRKNNKDVVVVVPDAFPAFLNWMSASEDIVHYDTQKEAAENAIEKADLIFSLDYNALGRIGDLAQPIEKSTATKIVIDHHQDPKDFADHYIVDTMCCSTSQLVYEFIDNLGELEKLDQAIAACIYCGIMTDTGSFRFPSTTSKTHQIIAHLIDLGADGSKIHQLVYDNYSEHRLRLLGHALTEKMQVFPQNGAAYISLSKRFSFVKGDTEGLVNYPLSIDGIKFSILLTEKNNEIRLSLRSKDDFHVNKIANEHFNGGGHIYAAGGMLESTLDEAIEKVEQIIKRYNN